MKKSLLLCTTLVPLMLYLFASCDNSKNITEADSVFEENPTTIAWNQDKSSDKITSYQTDVQVYRMNSREDTGLKLSDKYKMSVKMIDNVQYTRIDMVADSDGVYRSVLSDGEDLIICNTQTNDELLRINVSDKNNSSLRMFGGDNLGFGKIDIENVKSEAYRLSLDLSENTESSLLTLSLPQSMLVLGDGEKSIKSTISYDVSEEVVKEVQTVTVMDDETVVTSTLCPVYEDYEGTPVKIGTIFTINTQMAENVGEMPDKSMVYESMDDIPEISDEEFEAMQEAGNIYEDSSITFGDPANLSNIETVVELYTNIEINQTEDSVFKLLFDGE